MYVTLELKEDKFVEVYMNYIEAQDGGWDDESWDEHYTIDSVHYEGKDITRFLTIDTLQNIHEKINDY